MFSASKFVVPRDFILPKGVNFPLNVEKQIMIEYWFNQYEKKAESIDARVGYFETLCKSQVRASDKIWDAENELRIIEHNNALPTETVVGESDPRRLALLMTVEHYDGELNNLLVSKMKVCEVIRLLIKERKEIELKIANLVHVTGAFEMCKNKITKIKARGLREDIY